MEEFIYDNPGLIVGPLLIIAGILIGRYPKLMAVLYYASPKKRDNIDLRGLGRHVTMGLSMLGLLVMATDLLLEREEVQFFVRMIVILIGGFILLHTTRQYDHNQ